LSLVLCYHALSPTWRAALSVEPDAFRRQLQLLLSRGYRGRCFSEVVRKRGRGKLLAVTFDDAYRSVFELARPILAELGLPGSVFAVSGQIGRDGPMSWQGIDQWIGTPDEAELTPMTWEQLDELRSQGWEVGSHTRSHPHLTTVSDEEIEAELGESKWMLEQQLGEPCTSIAYPYGDHDERVMRAAEAAGYEAAGALPKRLRPRNPLSWPRIGVYHVDDMRRFRLKVSPSLRVVRGSPAWSLVKRASSSRAGGSPPT
jgi:peptidoglycan/xylan/chitin deacetylase (PgdA/CDA1 family)